jgi:WD40 repeat protein
MFAAAFCVPSSPELSRCMLTLHLGPDLNQVISGSDDRTLKLWDLRQPNSMCTAHGMYAPLNERVSSERHIVA